MKYRTSQMLELLKRCHKVKFTIDYEVYEILNLQKHLNELKKDTDLQITVIRVTDEIKITIELNEDEDRFQELLDNDEYVQDFLFGRL